LYSFRKLIFRSKNLTLDTDFIVTQFLKTESRKTLTTLPYNYITMSKYSTISVPEEVKQKLEENKGDREWGDYLLELYRKAEEERRNRAIKKISEILNEEDFENMRKSSTKFREDFKIQ